MLDDRNDINRPLGTDPLYDQRPRVPQNAGYGWSIPVGIAAVLLLGGYLLFNSGGHGPDQTASTTPAVTQTNPSGPARPAPARTPNPAR
jgi:hypothetical protein